MTLKAYQIETDANGALAMAVQRAQAFADAERADGTRKVYARAWKQWQAWAELMHTEALPARPEAVAAWLAELARAGKSVSTVTVRLAALLYVHRQKGVHLDAGHCAIRAVLGGIKRKCARPIVRARAMTPDVLAQLDLQIKDQTLRSLRDRAIILIGYFGALRRSEIASLSLTGIRSIIEISTEGAKLQIVAGKSSLKTEAVFLPRRGDGLCPVQALEDYIATAGINSGPLFRAISKCDRLLDRRLDAASINYILRARLGSLGSFSAHSLRAGLVTAAAKSHVPEHVIQRTTRHRSVDVLRTYIREAHGFESAAANYVGRE